MTAPAVSENGAGPEPLDPGAALLDVRDLSVEFYARKRWLRVVDGVTFQVKPGEVLGLVGESGSGKTVSSLGVMRLLPKNGRVASGQALFQGRDLVKLSTKELREVRGRDMAMIYQDALRCLNPAFSVGDQIAEAIRSHEDVSRADAMQRAKELLDVVEIPNAAQRIGDYPFMFSGGMCQRVMIAMALACRPQLLFADEPTTALDVTVQSQVLSLLKSLKKEFDLSIVFITHDLGVVAELCDRVAVMYAGQIVEVAERDEIFFGPTHPYTSGLLGALPLPDQAQRSFAYIPGTVPSPANWPAGCHFHPRCQYAVKGTCTDEVPELANRPRGEGVTRCVRASALSLIGVQQ
jgi:oligopeptide/dipeptide ABC transporter ATP-binding protein